MSAPFKTPSFFPKRRMEMVGTKRSALDHARGRMILVSAAFALAYILVAARVVDLSLLQGYLHGGGDTLQAEDAPPPEENATVRADIVDRNGVLLATSLDTASLYADPALITEPEKVAQGLVKIMPDLAYGDVLQKLQRRARFVWIRRNLTPQEQFAVLDLGQPGLNFRSERCRIYPQGPLAAHMVGYTDVDGHGLAGVERSFDKLLRKGDKPLRMTIDVRLQHILRRETARAVHEFSAKAGGGVILDVKTGEVLAAVSLPDFDPNNIAEAGPQDLFNRLTLGVYEPGSTFKIFSTAALLETQSHAISKTFDAREPLHRGRFIISDYHPEKRILTTPEVFMYSSNIGAAMMGETIGTEGLRSFYEELGLLTPLDLEISEVGRPLYPQPWREINTLTAAFGHGIAVAPLQTVAAAASVVGDGTLVRPTLIAGRAAENSEKSRKTRVVSPQTVERMRQMMRLVVTDGTGTFANVPGYNVGGKTGTAEKPDAGGYDRHSLVSSFLGFFPIEAPRYAVFVMVDEPHGNKASYGYATGGWVAAPAVARTVVGMAAVLGIPPEDTKPEDDLSAALMPYVHGKNHEGGSHLASY